MIIFRYSLVFCAALFASSCNQIASGGDDRICNAPTPIDLSAANKAQKSWQQMTLTENCIHRWGYRLAKSEGDNREIADAVVAACRDAILREGNMKFDEKSGTEPDAKDETLMFDDLRKSYGELALFRVVQARAGKCEPI
ncbi:hypothetical protein [Qipengyuania psychrotolerans]|uniref:Lipoprotein n=1 Tax=Qipengyuania psychrotolerans TaxID=2867238 RepID=A0ABX8ZD95_9SPHN|nr:hypothetical protein [Qipengyuania psychrotolerans]QZD86164.1 hypothetical protein K3166_07710 [Qipengyuania psychrotolerans]